MDATDHPLGMVFVQSIDQLWINAFKRNVQDRLRRKDYANFTTGEFAVNRNARIGQGRGVASVVDARRNVASTKAAPKMPSAKEVFAIGMGEDYAVSKDAPAYRTRMEFALSTVQRSVKNVAVPRDAPIKPRREGSVMGTGKGQNAVAKDALMALVRREESAGRTEQRSQLAAIAGAQPLFGRVVSAENTIIP